MPVSRGERSELPCKKSIMENCRRRFEQGFLSEHKVTCLETCPGTLTGGGRLSFQSIEARMAER